MSLLLVQSIAELFYCFSLSAFALAVRAMSCPYSPSELLKAWLDVAVDYVFEQDNTLPCHDMAHSLACFVLLLLCKADVVMALLQIRSKPHHSRYHQRQG